MKTNTSEHLEVIFLSTLSLRRATGRRPIFFWRAKHFYPRSPCGERRKPRALKSLRCVFLSTLSLRRATGLSYFYIIKITDFYPRSPCGERPYSIIVNPSRTAISIHALLAESDLFNTMQIVIVVIFLSTLSLRRATAKVHKTVGHFCAYETNFMGIASSC